MSTCREFVNGCCKDNYLQILVIPVYKKESLGHLDREVFQEAFCSDSKLSCSVSKGAVLAWGLQWGISVGEIRRLSEFF